VDELVLENLYFAAAHYLPGHEKCSAIHGHTYTVRRLVVCTEKFVDLGELKAIIKEYDHVLLVPKKHEKRWKSLTTELAQMGAKLRIVPIDPEPTVENIIRDMVKRIEKRTGAKVACLEIFESPNAGALKRKRCCGGKRK